MSKKKLPKKTSRLAAELQRDLGEFIGAEHPLEPATLGRAKLLMNLASNALESLSNQLYYQADQEARNFNNDLGRLLTGVTMPEQIERAVRLAEAAGEARRAYFAARKNKNAEAKD